MPKVPNITLVWTGWRTPISGSLRAPEGPQEYTQGGGRTDFNDPDCFFYVISTLSRFCVPTAYTCGRRPSLLIAQPHYYIISPCSVLVTFHSTFHSFLCILRPLIPLLSHSQSHCTLASPSAPGPILRALISPPSSPAVSPCGCTRTSGMKIPQRIARVQGQTREVGFLL